jgi:hypothetical protein
MNRRLFLASTAAAAACVALPAVAAAVADEPVFSVSVNQFYDEHGNLLSQIDFYDDGLPTDDEWRSVSARVYRGHGVGWYRRLPSGDIEIDWFDIRQEIQAGCSELI